MNGDPNGGRVNNSDLARQLEQIDRAQEARMSEVRGDVRSIKQTIDQVIAPKLQEHDDELAKLQTRFVYALTIIGSAIGAVLFLALRGWGGIGT